MRMHSSSTTVVSRTQLSLTRGVEDKQAHGLTCMSADCGRQMRSGRRVDGGRGLLDETFDGFQAQP